MRRIFVRLAFIAVAAIALVSGCDCSHQGPDKTGYGKVMVMYSAGYNSLSTYLKEDIEDLKKGYVPDKKSDDVLLLVSHLPLMTNNFSTPTSPVLVRLYKDRKAVVMDTLERYSGETYLSRAVELNKILSTIKTQFPADHYGFVFSSHSTGWVPKGYYSFPEEYDSKSDGKFRAPRRSAIPEGAVRYNPEKEFPGAPDVKSMGSTNVRTDDANYSYEIDLQDFADAFPMHFDYIILDACLAGGVEVAYELKDKCDLICFSPAEILADGLVYTKLASNLLEHDMDVVEVAKDYYLQYKEKTNTSDQSATISVVDCTKMDALASCCTGLFSKYRDQIAALNPKDVQGYYRSFHHWYYDLEDMLIKAGITNEEEKQLADALEECIKYKATTNGFLMQVGGFKITHYSGLSMYLPCDGSAYLNDFYRKLEWNKTTKLVE